MAITYAILYVHSIILNLYIIAIEVSVKPASSSQVTTKRVTLNLTGDIPAMQNVEDTSVGGHKFLNVNDYLIKLFLCTSVLCRLPVIHCLKM